MVTGSLCPLADSGNRRRALEPKGKKANTFIFIMSDDFKSRFAAIAETTVEEQANTFLRSFVMEFQGNFEEVLELAQQFKKVRLVFAYRLRC